MIKISEAYETTMCIRGLGILIAQPFTKEQVWISADQLNSLVEGIERLAKTLEDEITLAERDE